MALIIYPDTGYDSFSSIADADAYLASNVPSSQRTLWEALVDADKEIYLRQSTTLIENKITLPDTLEENLQNACIYLANYSVGLDMLNSDGETGNIKVDEVVGVVKTEYFGASKDSDSFPSIVDLLLADYGLVTDGSFSFERS